MVCGNFRPWPIPNASVNLMFHMSCVSDLPCHWVAVPLLWDRVLPVIFAIPALHFRWHIIVVEGNSKTGENIDDDREYLGKHAHGEVNVPGARRAIEYCQTSCCCRIEGRVRSKDGVDEANSEEWKCDRNTGEKLMNLVISGLSSYPSYTNIPCVCSSWSHVFSTRRFHAS